MEDTSLDIFLFYVVFNSQGHIAMGSLWLEELLVGQDSAM